MGELSTLFHEVTGERATRWGPSVIGFGHDHDAYASGRESDTFRVDFSPRQADLALYGLQNDPRSGELLDRLGTLRRGAGCVGVRKLEAIDLAVLRDLIALAREAEPDGC